MPVRQHALGVGATQNINDVVRAEEFPGALDWSFRLAHF